MNRGAASGGGDKVQYSVRLRLSLARIGLIYPSQFLERQLVQSHLRLDRINALAGGDTTFRLWLFRITFHYPTGKRVVL